MNNKKKFWAMGLLCLTLAGPVGAATLEEAAEAVKAQDFVKAARILTELANQGSRDAQFLLAMMFENGRGVSKDEKEAVKWYRKAAEQGHSAAQNNLGQMYRQGRGVKADLAEAVKWFRKAAEQDNAVAQYNLGVRYMRGEGIEKNPKEGAAWYRKAAEQKNPHAQFSLAYCYASGQGVEKNLVEAYAWAKAASTANFNRARQMVGYLESQLTPEDLQAGEARFQAIKQAQNLPDAPEPLGPQGEKRDILQEPTDED